MLATILRGGYFLPNNHTNVKSDIPFASLKVSTVDEVTIYEWQVNDPLNVGLLLGQERPRTALELRTAQNGRILDVELFDSGIIQPEAREQVEQIINIKWPAKVANAAR